MAKYLFQHAAGTEYQALISASKEWHKDACKEHGIELFVHGTRTDTGAWSHNSEALVAFAQFIIGDDFFEGPKLQNGDEVYLIDTDALWIGKKTSLSESLVNGDVAFTFRENGYVNCGFLAVRVTEKTRALFAKILNEGPNHPSKTSDMKLIDEVATNKTVKFSALGNKWNWIHKFQGTLIPMDCPRTQAVVLHWPSVNRKEVAILIKSEISGVSLVASDVIPDFPVFRYSEVNEEGTFVEFGRNVAAIEIENFGPDPVFVKISHIPSQELSDDQIRILPNQAPRKLTGLSTHTLGLITADGKKSAVQVAGLRG